MRHVSSPDTAAARGLLPLGNGRYRCASCHGVDGGQLDVEAIARCPVFDAGSKEFKLLEVCVMSRGNGLPIETPAVRF